MKGERLKSKKDAPMQQHILGNFSEIIKVIYTLEKPILVKPNEAARDIYIKYFNTIEKELGIGGELSCIAPYGGKAATQMSKLAALFHLYKKTPEEIKALNEAETDGRIVVESTPADFLDAIRVSSYLLTTQRQQETPVDKITIIAHTIADRFEKGVNKITKKQFITRRELTNCFQRQLEGVDTTAVLECLEKQDVLKKHEDAYENLLYKKVEQGE